MLDKVLVCDLSRYLGINVCGSAMSWVSVKWDTLVRFSFMDALSKSLGVRNSSLSRSSL